ncbi:MAG: HD domain-containing protein [Clostridia bacterium]|jgi:HD superfamily phosphohydrolase YqeK|nr:HD domain-containing protein [Clostridia bacterium]
MNYIDVLNDSKIIRIYGEIDKTNPYPFNHGLKHINNVLENVNRMVEMIEISDIDKRDLLIATVLHDTGRLFDDANHAKASSSFIKEYLNGKIEIESIEKIINLVSNHGTGGDSKKKDFLSKILIFCDKMDFSKKRLVYECEEKFGEVIYSIIEKVNFNILDKTLIVEVEGLKEKDIEAFEESVFYPKVVKAIKIFSEEIRANYKIRYIQ